MAETKTLNVRLQQRWATADEWKASTLILLPGEMAIESDTGKFKFGDGEHTFSQIPNYAGIQQSDLDAIEDTCHVVNSIEERDALTKKQGDIVVVKELISGNKYSMTAYMCSPDSEKNLVWQALDGNYDANDVYFSENVTVTTTVGNITTSNNTPKELAFAGKNLKQVYEYLYAKEDNQIAVDGTSASISLSKTSDSLEVGTAYTLPTASVSTSAGKYKEYGGKNAEGTAINKDTKLTDVKFDLVLKYTAPNASAVQIASVTEGSSIAATAVPEENQPTTKLATDTAITHTFSGTYAHNASGFKPVTNLGNFVSAINSASATTSANYDDGVTGIPAKTTTNMSNATYKVTGFRKWYYGGDNKTDFDVATIKGLSKSTGAVANTTFELKAASYAGCSRIVIAIPDASGKQVTSVLLKSSSNADITGEFKRIDTATNKIQLGGVNNYSPVDYKVWEYKPASLDSTEVYTITIG